MYMSDDFSQHGEFEKVLKPLLSAKPGFFVDIGSHGEENSNTLALSRHHGWSGLVIEALPHAHELNCEAFGDTVECIHMGVLPRPLGFNRTSKFYVSSKVGHSSFQKSHVPDSDLVEVIDVPTNHLASLLIEKEVPLDFEVLDIDVEGIDSEIVIDLLKATGYRPKVIIIERPNRDAVAAMESTRYSQIWQNDINQIFRRDAGTHA